MSNPARTNVRAMSFVIGYNNLYNQSTIPITGEDLHKALSHGLEHMFGAAVVEVIPPQITSDSRTTYVLVNVDVPTKNKLTRGSTGAGDEDVGI